MDDIWKNAARKVHAHEKRAATHSATTTTTATTPAAAAAVTTFSTDTVTATENTAMSSAPTEEDMNTVKKLTHNSLVWSKIGPKRHQDHFLRGYET